MKNPGFFSLGNFPIAAAGTQVGDWTTCDLSGLLALAAQLRLAYGSSGTTVKAYLQTSLDQGGTPIDIACVVFGTASEVEVMNFSALTPKGQVVPSDGSLADDTLVDGILGDRFRLKVISTGTYGGSTILTAGAVAR
jgi:hypothetical protein